MRWYYILPMSLLAAPLQAAPPTLDAFSADALARLEQALPGREVRRDTVDPLKLTVLKKGKESEFTIYFDRIWRYCQQASVEDCTAARADFIAKTLAPRDRPTARSLRYVVRGKDYVSAIEEMGRKKRGEKLAYVRPIGGDLFKVLVADSKDSVSMIGSAALKDLGLSEEDAWRIAEPQTRSLLPKVPDAAAVAKQWTGFQGPQYMGSMLGLTEDWAWLAEKAGPNLFVTAATDQLVIVGLSPPGPDFEKLIKAVKEDCDAAERCISPHVYRFREGKWAVADQDASL